jgi:hypothetical protein
LEGWPTAKVAMGDYCYSNGNHDKPVLNLSGIVRSLWETPTKSGNPPKSKRAKEVEKSTPSLTEQARAWLTPAVTHSEGKGDLVQAIRGNSNSHFATSVGRAVRANLSTIGKPRGSLNPAWVRSLLGWPENYYNALAEAITEYQLTKPRAGRTKAS